MPLLPTAASRRARLDAGPGDDLVAPARFLFFLSAPLPLPPPSSDEVEDDDRLLGAVLVVMDRVDTPATTSPSGITVCLLSTIEVVLPSEDEDEQ